MVTLKDIATLANVSASTVSIVLNGKAEERKISPKTVQKIQQIVAETGYRPNVSAVGLRISESSSAYNIIIFWTTDFRASMMVRFIKSIENEILQQNYFCEILLRPYSNGKLNESLTESLLRTCHGAIVCNASETDMEYLEISNFSKPIVLYNRYSKKYPTVTIDDRKIGSLPAQIFASHKKKHPVIIASPATFNGMNLRTNLFMYQCAEHHMETPQIIYTEPTMNGGYQAVKKALDSCPSIDCIFFTTDQLAIGALPVFHKYNIRIPEDIEIIAVGNNIEEQTAFSYPSISIIYIPIEQMARECLRILYQKMAHLKMESAFVSLPVNYIPRASCPPKA